MNIFSKTRIARRHFQGVLGGKAGVVRSGEGEGLLTNQCLGFHKHFVYVDSLIWGRQNKLK